ncbi:MAG: aminoacyl-tRNA hydrolase [Planctomycetia bacterium]|nr:aminoacyl-tRNA hydrolase [Planctomycetia bacterium]
MIINERYHIPDEELIWTFARSGGPGGQNVNKVNSRAVLHWRLGANTSLPPHVRDRIRALERNRLTTEGDLLLQSQTHRTQERNREACLERLADIVRRALIVPRVRYATKPTRGSQLRRLEAKKARGRTKQERRGPNVD